MCTLVEVLPHARKQQEWGINVPTSHNHLCEHLVHIFPLCVYECGDTCLTLFYENMFHTWKIAKLYNIYKGTSPKPRVIFWREGPLCNSTGLPH